MSTLKADTIQSTGGGGLLDEATAQSRGLILQELPRQQYVILLILVV